MLSQFNLNFPLGKMDLSFKSSTIFSIILCSVILSVQSLITLEQDLTLTANQKQSLDKLKNAVVSKMPHKYMQEDLYLLKWLRQSKFDVKVAENRLLANVEWRRENNMDTIHTEDWAEFIRDFPYYLDGRDRYGRPILRLEVRGLDLRRAIVQGKFEKLSRFGDKIVDEHCTLVRQLGEKYKNITRGHFFINVDGFTVAQQGCLQCTPFLIRLFLMFQQQYPECLDQIIVFNTPSAIEPLLHAIRQILSQDVRSRLTFYGTNKNQWIQDLSKDFDFSLLPRTIGGTKIDPSVELDDNE